MTQFLALVVVVALALPAIAADVFGTWKLDLVNRPSGGRLDERVKLGEARRGEATPIRVWYAVGNETGRAFIY